MPDPDFRPSALEAGAFLARNAPDKDNLRYNKHNEIYKLKKTILTSTQSLLEPKVRKQEKALLDSYSIYTIELIWSRALTNHMHARDRLEAIWRHSALGMIQNLECEIKELSLREVRFWLSEWREKWILGWGGGSHQTIAVETRLPQSWPAAQRKTIENLQAAARRTSGFGSTWTPMVSARAACSWRPCARSGRTCG